MDIRRVGAELLGTYAFFLIGMMAIQSTLAMNGPDLLVIAFGFGLGLFAAFQVWGRVSGGMFNPSVAIAATLDGRLDPIGAVSYIIAQLIGGLAAAATVAALLGQSAVAATITKPGGGLTDVQALGAETIFTAIFIAVILSVSKHDPGRAALVISLTLVVMHLALVPLSGASLNPVRSIASAVVAGDLTGLWIYLVGPTLGAVIGWGLFRLFDDVAADG